MASLLLHGIFADQILNMYIQANYEDLGLETTFYLWWSKFYIENIGNIISVWIP